MLTVNRFSIFANANAHCEWSLFLFYKLKLTKIVTLNMNFKEIDT